MTMGDVFIILGFITFAFLALAWAYVSYTRRLVCPLMADSLANGAVLCGAISVILLSNALDLVTPPNRASINILFSLVTLIVQVQIILVHRSYHRIVGPMEPGG